MSEQTDESGSLEIFKRFSAGLKVPQAYAPGITAAEVCLLILIAWRTNDRNMLDLPTKTDLARSLGLPPSGASRLIDALTLEGRSREGQLSSRKGGYGLIETNSNVQGRRIEAFVLTSKGRECVTKMMEVIFGQAGEDFRPYDLNSLFKLLLIDLLEQAKKKR